ncbi:MULTISPECIES: polyphosphate kinase 1 [Anaerolinea]|uniref:polyphosphate kinase 1 n=1 Tax=Anaerolinea TaxID=233189 RepID=UPI00262D84B9|nr:polyphosphate kinase 1 [Anaerolinea thermophila]
MDNPVFDPQNLDSPDLYLNRELSLLEFQYRVLDEARDPTNPLLERVKFLAIVGSNLEEFFMVRVGGLKMQKETGVFELPPDGLTPSQQLAEIRKVALKLMEKAQIVWQEELLPALRENGIYVLDYHELTPKQRESVNAYFHEIIYPVLTPLAYDPGHPFPHISNLSLNLAVMVRGKNNIKRFARIKVPPSLPQLVPIKRSSGSTRKDGTSPKKHYFVWIDQVIQANLSHLFPGMEVMESHAFHVTRNSDMEIQELEALDLLDLIEESVRKRRFGAVTRLMIHPDMSPEVRKILVENLKVEPNEIYELSGPLVLSNLFELTRIDRYDLKDKPFYPAIPEALKKEPLDEGNIFHAIRQKDILLHHPYDSFNPVIDFLRAASRDPHVLAIKQTLYRVGKDSPVVRALLEAQRDYGKQVAVLVELKARFDEESNIGWAKILEQEGVHVIYGLLGLKTHSKVALVVRKEGNHIRRYIHLSTGNYNHITANIYEDIGMFTCDEEIGADASDLFNYLTGYSSRDTYRKLLVAPINLRQQFEALIRQEIAHQKAGKQGYLLFKMNALVDKPIIRLLYEASQAGVKIDLIVRGMCCLRPGIPGISENITVRSIVGRFLEHSRIYYFQNAGEEIIYMGSADLMPRNLNQRVEVLFPVEDPQMIRTIRDEILETYLKDNVKARIMQPDGSYKRIKPQPGEPIINAQETFIARRREAQGEHG